VARGSGAFALAPGGPSLLNLLFEMVEAATRTNLDEKIQLLGKVLANAASSTDAAVIDQQALLLKALAELKAPHVEILKIIAEHTTTGGWGRGKVSLSWKSPKKGQGWKVSAATVPFSNSASSR
jgi:hypothetical protein